MFDLENRGKTLIFMSRHFDETWPFWFRIFSVVVHWKILTGNYFVLRKNKIIYSKQEIGCFYSF